MFNFELVIDQEEVKRGLIAEIIRRLNAAFYEMVGPVGVRVRQRIKELIDGSPEYESMVNGELRGHLGLVDASLLIEVIIKKIQDNVVVESEAMIRRGEDYVGGMVVKVLRQDFQDVLGLDVASYVSVNKLGEEHPVDWLRWLLLEGSDEIIETHWYLNSDDTSDYSRTKLGIMVPVGGSHQGWSVPELTGTLYDNWLTRALKPLAEGEIGFMLKEEFNRRF